MHLAEPCPDRVDGFLVRRLLCRRELDAKALSQRFRCPQQLRRLIRPLRETSTAASPSKQ